MAAVLRPPLFQLIRAAVMHLLAIRIHPALRGKDSATSGAFAPLCYQLTPANTHTHLVSLVLDAAFFIWRLFPEFEEV